MHSEPDDERNRCATAAEEPRDDVIGAINS